MTKKAGKKQSRRVEDHGGKPTTPRPRFPVAVKQGDEEVPKEVLADAIVKISEGFGRLKRSGLNRRAIVVLVRDASGVGITDILKVLDSLEDLRGMYT